MEQPDDLFQNQVGRVKRIRSQQNIYNANYLKVYILHLCFTTKFLRVGLLLS